MTVPSRFISPLIVGARTTTCGAVSHALTLDDMRKPNTARTLQTGLAMAAGLFVANSVVMPLISERSVFDGIMIGFIAAFLVLAVYSVIAIRQSRGGSSR